mgnify:CR=1 FL=1
MKILAMIMLVLLILAVGFVGYVYCKILYPISDYPHEHYTFKHFEV